MFRAGDLSPLALLAALALASCAAPQERAERVVENATENAMDAMNAAVADAQAQAEAEEAANQAMADAVNQAQAAVNEAAAGAEEAVASSIAEEFPETARNCHLPEATLTRDGADYRLNLPPAIYAAREREPVHGRMLCITHWGLERGLDLDIVEAR